ncbi:coiled-coil domain-containing protein 17 [Cyanocitta cristata]
MGGFLCPRCRLAFGSQQLLQVHLEKLCLGPVAPSSSCLHRGDPLPVEGAQGTARKPQDASVGVSQNTDDAEPRHHFVLPGVPPAVRGQREPGRARGAPLGDVLTPRERALLRTADPTSRRLTAEGSAGGWRHWGPGQLWAPSPSTGSRSRARPRGTRPDRSEQHSTERPAEPWRWLIQGSGRALRLSYLRSGGHDPAVLDQLLHLQLEATVLEKGTAGPGRGRPLGKCQHQAQACPPTGTVAPQPAPEVLPAVPAEPPGTGTHALDAALLAVELENRRLEDELLALKVRRERRADAGSRAAQRHTEELAKLQAEVGMLRCHAEQMRPWLHPAVLPPPIAPPLLPALAVPELFTVRASALGNFQLSKDGRGEVGLGCQLGWNDGCGGTSLGTFGTTPFAVVGDRATGAGGESPPVLDQGWDLLCTPSGTCEEMAGQLLPMPGQDSARTLLPLTSLFSFPRSPRGQRWGLAAPQPMYPLESPSPPLWPWRTLLLLRSPQKKTGLPKGCSKLREAPLEPTSGSALNEQNSPSCAKAPEGEKVRSLDKTTVNSMQYSSSLQQPSPAWPIQPSAPASEGRCGWKC